LELGQEPGELCDLWWGGKGWLVAIRTRSQERGLKGARKREGRKKRREGVLGRGDEGREIYFRVLDLVGEGGG